MSYRNIFTCNPPTIEQAACFVFTSHQVSTTEAQKNVKTHALSRLKHLQSVREVSRSFFLIYQQLIVTVPSPNVTPKGNILTKKMFILYVNILHQHTNLNI